MRRRNYLSLSVRSGVPWKMSSGINTQIEMAASPEYRMKNTFNSQHCECVIELLCHQNCMHTLINILNMIYFKANCITSTCDQCKKGYYFFSQPLEIKSGPLQVQIPRMRANVLCIFLSRFLKEAQLCGVWWRLYITLHSLVCPSSCVSNGCKYGRKIVNYWVSFLGCQRQTLWVGRWLWPVT